MSGAVLIADGRAQDAAHDIRRRARGIGTTARSPANAAVIPRIAPEAGTQIVMGGGFVWLGAIGGAWQPAGAGQLFPPWPKAKRRS